MPSQVGCCGILPWTARTTPWRRISALALSGLSVHLQSRSNHPLRARELCPDGGCCENAVVMPVIRDQRGPRTRSRSGGYRRRCAVEGERRRSISLTLLTKANIRHPRPLENNKMKINSGFELNEESVSSMWARGGCCFRTASARTEAGKTSARQEAASSGGDRRGTRHTQHPTNGIICLGRVQTLSIKTSPKPLGRVTLRVLYT